MKTVNISESYSTAPAVESPSRTANGTSDRVATSAEILGYDCGGQQLVFEVCFPMSTKLTCTEVTNGKTIEYSKDILFVRRLLKAIEDARIPAHSPIEMR